mgnify:CR=1 FL=1
MLVSSHEIKNTRDKALEKCTPYEFGYNGLFESSCELKEF